MQVDGVLQCLDRGRSKQCTGQRENRHVERDLFSGRQLSVSLRRRRSEVTWENGVEHSGSWGFADTEEDGGSTPPAPTICSLTSTNAKHQGLVDRFTGTQTRLDEPAPAVKSTLLVNQLCSLERWARSAWVGLGISRVPARGAAAGVTPGTGRVVVRWREPSTRSGRGCDVSMRACRCGGTGAGWTRSTASRTHETSGNGTVIHIRGD